MKSSTIRGIVGLGILLGSVGYAVLADDCTAPPAAPSLLTVNGDPMGDPGRYFSWMDNSSDEEGFRIEVRYGPADSYSWLTSVGADETAWELFNGSMGAQYRICAYNACGISDYSYFDFGQGGSFDAPQNLAATVHRDEDNPDRPGIESFTATLTWENYALDAQGIVVQYSTSPLMPHDESNVMSIQLPADATQFEYPIYPDGSMFFRVKVLLPDNRFAMSSEISVQCTMPYHLYANPSELGVHIDWSFSAWGLASGFVIERRQPSSPEMTDWVQVGTVDADARSFEDASVERCSHYEYRVYADLSGTPSDYSLNVTVSVLDPAPVPPSDFTAKIVSGGVQLKWTDNSYDEDFFYITREEPLGPVYTVGTTEFNQIWDPFVLSGKSVTYTVRAQAECNSSEVQVTISDRDGDGMADEWEQANGLDVHVNEANLDPDQDTVINQEEYVNGLNPHVFDTIYEERVLREIGPMASVNDFNEKGEIIGQYQVNGVSRSFKTTQNYYAFELLPFTAEQINNKGQMVGRTATRAVVRDFDQLMELHVAGKGASSACAINDAGAVAGQMSWPPSSQYYPEFHERAFVWQNGTYTHAPALGGDWNTVARDMDEQGRVLGRAEQYISNRQPSYGFVLENGQMNALPGEWFSPRQMNNHQQIIGTIGPRGVVYENGQCTTLRLNTYDTEPSGISDAGQIVGTTVDNNTGRRGPAFFYENGMMKDLQSIVLSYNQLDSSRVSSLVMNKAGQIALVQDGLLIVLTARNKDSDEDGLSDCQEFDWGSNPFDTDSDHDGMPDAWEFSSGSSPSMEYDVDFDNDYDGVGALAEYKAGLSPWTGDTDGDGIMDGLEDADADGMADWWELLHDLNHQVNDTVLDPDADGLNNLQEFALQTNPNLADTDQDGVLDPDEVSGLSNPNRIDRWTGGTVKRVPEVYYVGLHQYKGYLTEGPVGITWDVAHSAGSGIEFSFEDWAASVTVSALTGQPLDYPEWLQIKVTYNNGAEDVFACDGANNIADHIVWRYYAMPRFQLTAPAGLAITKVTVVSDNSDYSSSVQARIDAWTVSSLDTDNDGLRDCEEIRLGTKVDDSDSDNDGLLDGCEVEGGTNPLLADTDADGLNDAEEVALDLNPTSSDSDNDGSLDGAEVSVAQTDPLDPDTDRDGWKDGVDPNPKSRVFADWGNPKQRVGATGVDSAYWPSWCLSATVSGAGYVDEATSSFNVDAGVANYSGSMYFTVDPAQLAGKNLRLWTKASTTRAGYFFGQLRDAAWNCPLNDFLTPNYQNGQYADTIYTPELAQSAGELSVNVPLARFPTACHIILHRASGDLTHYDSALFLDTNGDGIDDTQLEAVLAATGDTDFDQDGLIDLWEYHNGLDFAKADQDGNGVVDGADDFDSDGVSNAEEQPSDVSPEGSDPLRTPAEEAAEAANRSAVSGGADHSLAVKDDGRVWAWGSYQYGQLGLGWLGNGKISTPTPVAIEGDPSVVEVDATFMHSLALAEDGKVYAWGSNINGDLGLGTSGNNMAAPVQMTNLPPMRKIAAGYFHNLGIAKNGRLWVWGSGWDGQLGVGTASTGYKPMAGRLDQVVDIAAGTRHSVALKSDGTVWTWGQNTYGQVGNGTQGNNVALPVQVLSGAKAVSAGFNCTFALMDDGTVMAWGLNDVGQLGSRFRTNRIRPTLVPGLTDVVKLAAYGQGAMALKADGTLWIWGGNGNGQLGNNLSGDSLGPIQVAVAPDVGMLLGPGGWHNLIAVGNGEVYSWGANHNDQLGYASPQNPHRQPITAVPDGQGGGFNLQD